MCESLLRVTGLVPLTWMFPSRWCRSDRWAGWRCPTDRPCVQTLPSFIFKYLGLAALCPLDITQQPWILGTRHVGAELTVTYTVSNDTIPRKHEVTTMRNTFILAPVPRILEGKENFLEGCCFLHSMFCIFIAKNMVHLQNFDMQCWTPPAWIKNKRIKTERIIRFKRNNSSVILIDLFISWPILITIAQQLLIKLYGYFILSLCLPKIANWVKTKAADSVTF